MKIAFYDIGTNSIHMKIVQIHPDRSFEVLEHVKDMTRIGDGSFRSRKLSKAAMRRALKILAKFSKMAEREGVKKTVAVATSAVREAKNGSSFVKTVYKKTGIKVSIISGREEGRLIFLGASSGVEPLKGKLLVVDVGGGSAEFVLGDRSRIDYDESFLLGAARLKDRFLKKDPPSKENLRNLEEYVDEKLDEVAEATGRKKFSSVIGTGGTMINLASMIYEAKESRPLRLRGYFEVHAKDIRNLYRRLCSMPTSRIRKQAGIDKKRSDIIIAGSALVSRIMDRLEVSRIFISDKGIREGMILSCIVKKWFKKKGLRPSLKVQWFGQKPFFSGRIIA